VFLERDEVGGLMRCGEMNVYKVHMKWTGAIYQDPIVKQ
jgi:hypothetical protein